MKATINIPENLNEITLGQYQQFLHVAEGKEGVELAQRTVNILCDYPLHSISMLKVKDVNEISEHLNLLFSIEQELTPKFNIQGQKFGFIPDLENISFGEYVDLDKYVNDWSTMHQAMAVLYRPIKNEVGEQYDIIDYNGTGEFADLMRFMPLGVALGSLVFFYRLGNELLKATRSYLLNQMRELEKVTTQKGDNSINSGDGITASMPYLEETLEHLTKLPDFQPLVALHT